MNTNDISHEQVLAALSYDPETGVLRWRNRRNGVSVAGAIAGDINNRGYWRVSFAGQRFMAHRLAWFYVHGEWPAHLIDHINGDRADNRLCNLRDVTVQVNGQNRAKPTSISKSGVLGVYPHGTRFRVQITTGDGSMLHVGVYDSVEAARQAYLNKKAEVHVGFVADRFLNLPRSTK